MRALVTLAVASLAACVTSTVHYYVPTEGEPRVTREQLRQQAEAVLQVECPRLLAGRATAFGATEMALDLDRAGGVARARITRRSSDRTFDRIVGGLAAQLRLDSASAERRGHARVRIGYSCSPHAAVATVETMS